MTPGWLKFLLSAVFMVLVLVATLQIGPAKLWAATRIRMASEERRDALLLAARCSDRLLPWVNFVMLAPSPAVVDTLAMSSLHSVAELQLADQLCHIRVVVVLGGASSAALTKSLVREWADIHGIDVHFVSSHSKASDLARLRVALAWLASHFPHDIAFFHDAGIVFPRGFAGVVRSSVRPGRSALAPYVFELRQNCTRLSSGHWVAPAVAIATNIGVYVDDAASHKLYSTPHHTPFIALRDPEYGPPLQLITPQLDGLYRPSPLAAPANEITARKHKQIDERGKNRRPSWV